MIWVSYGALSSFKGERERATSRGVGGRSGYMESSMAMSTATTTPQEQVNALIKVHCYM
jgi:hypothetical protein